MEETPSDQTDPDADFGLFAWKSAVASSFEPGLWGNRTACGQILILTLTGTEKSPQIGAWATAWFGTPKTGRNLPMQHVKFLLPLLDNLNHEHPLLRSWRSVPDTCGCSTRQDGVFPD